MGDGQGGVVLGASAVSRAAKSPWYDGPCIVARVVGSTAARRITVGPTWGPRDVMEDLSAVKLASTMSSLVRATSPPIWVKSGPGFGSVTEHV